MADFSGVDDAQTTDTGEEQGGQDQEQALHPSWQNAFNAIPEDLRDTPWTKDLRDQIQASERNARKAIEDAKQGGVAPEWREFISNATEAGLDVNEVVEGFNTSFALRQQIAEDPDGFLDAMEKNIREGVANGTLTAREGSKLRKAAAEAAEEVDLDDDPRAKEINELKERMNARDRAEFERQEREQYEQEQYELQEDAKQAGEDFIAAANSAFERHGLAERTGQTKAIIAQVAAQYMEGDERITESAAMDRAIADFQREFGLPVTTGGKPARVPIGGGSNAQVAEAPQKFTSDKERENAMINEARRLAAEE
jgi:hypothetical protein